jgi:hypothetical protein
MIYVVHTYYNGETVHTHKYMTIEEAFLDYNSYTLAGLKEGTPYKRGHFVLSICWAGLFSTGKMGRCKVSCHAAG